MRRGTTPDFIISQNQAVERTKELNQFMREMREWEYAMKKKEEETKLKLTEEDFHKRENALYKKDQGNEFVKEGCLEKAISCYTNAIEEWPRDASFFFNRGVCYYKEKMYKEAERDFTNAQALDFKYLKVYHMRAITRMELENFKGATEDINTGLGLEPNNAVLKNDLKTLEEMRKKWNEKTFMKSVIDFQDDSADKRFEKFAYLEKDKGNKCVKLGKWEDAVCHYKIAVELYKQDATFYTNLALAYFKLGKMGKCVTCCDNALKLTNSVKAHYRRGKALKELGRLEEARVELETARDMEPGGNSFIGKELAGILSGEGERFQVESWKTAVMEKTVADVSREKGWEVTEIFEQNASTGDDEILKLSLKAAKMESEETILSEKGAMNGGSYHSPLEEADAHVSPPDIMDFKIRRAIEKYQRKRINGDNILDEEGGKEEELVDLSLPQLNLNLELPPEPRNYLQFYESWITLKFENPRLRFPYLKSIDPRKFRCLFGNGLDPVIFCEIVQVLCVDFVASALPIYPYLLGLSKVERFQTISLFMQPHELKLLDETIKNCEGQEGISKMNVQRLRNIYSCV